jgi:hypothetical protein
MRSDRSNNRNIQSMKRRTFVQISSAMMATAALNPYGFAQGLDQIDASWSTAVVEHAGSAEVREGVTAHRTWPSA